MTERKEIDTTRACVTRDGEWDAEYIRTINGDRRLWVLTGRRTGLEEVFITTLDGRTSRGKHRDIINAPQTREVWLPVNRSSTGELSIEKEDIEYDVKPSDNYGGRYFLGWQRATITDKPQGED